MYSRIIADVFQYNLLQKARELDILGGISEASLY